MSPSFGFVLWFVCANKRHLGGSGNVSRCFLFGMPAVTSTAELTCTPLKSLLQYTLHWYTAARSQQRPCGCSENCKPAACSLLLRCSLPQEIHIMIMNEPRCCGRMQELKVSLRKWALYVHFYYTYHKVKSSLSTLKVSSCSNGLPVNRRTSWPLLETPLTVNLEEFESTVRHRLADNKRQSDPANGMLLIT